MLPSPKNAGRCPGHHRDLRGSRGGRVRLASGAGAGVAGGPLWRMARPHGTAEHSAQGFGGAWPWSGSFPPDRSAARTPKCSSRWPGRWVPFRVAIVFSFYGNNITDSKCFFGNIVSNQTAGSDFKLVPGLPLRTRGNIEWNYFFLHCPKCTSNLPTQQAGGQLHGGMPGNQEPAVSERQFFSIQTS